MDIPITQITALIQAQTGGAAVGTGLVPLLKKSKVMFKGTIPPTILSGAQKLLPATFGGYPDHNDIAPAAVFLSLYLVMTVVHSYIFFKNWSRGHKFYTSLIFMLYGSLNWIGYTLRLCWAQDITRAHIGLAATVMILTSTVLLAGGNILLAQRIFTWRQPRIGASKLFSAAMWAIYVMVLATILCGVVAGVVPYLYFLGEEHFEMCKKAARAAGVLTIVYSATALGLILLAFMFKPLKESHEFVIYQPWWIESFGMTYFVPKNAVKVAQDTFEHRPDHHKKAVRVIVSSTHHYNTIEDLKSATQSEPPVLSHNYSIFIILFTVIMLFVSSSFRCASLFVDRHVYNQTWVHTPVTMYCTHGMIEFLILLFYAVTRVDLRFYKPDYIRHHDTAASQHTISEKEDELLAAQVEQLSSTKAPHPTSTTTPRDGSASPDKATV